VDHGGHVEGDELADEQAADDDEAQGAAAGAVGAEAEGDGQGAHQGGQGGHDDRAEAVHAGVVDGLLGALAFVDALEGEVNDHDAVLLDDAHQHEHADEGVEGGDFAEEPEGGQAPHQGDGQGGEDGDGVEVAFVEDAEDHIHDENGQDHQDDEAGDGFAEGLGLPLEAAADGGG